MLLSTESADKYIVDMCDLALLVGIEDTELSKTLIRGHPTRLKWHVVIFNPTTLSETIQRIISGEATLSFDDNEHINVANDNGMTTTVQRMDERLDRLEDPNDTAYKRWSCHSGFKLLCKLCRTSPPPAMGARFTVFWACRPCGPAGWLALLLTKAGDVETNPGPTTLNKKVWICDICHKQIHVRKQISIRCNRIEHWVHLRCAGIRQAQYTDTWTCHLHRESRLTPHTDITPPHRSRPLSKPPTHSPPTPPTPPQPKHRHMSNTPPVPRGHKQIHISPIPVTANPFDVLRNDLVSDGVSCVMSTSSKSKVSHQCGTIPVTPIVFTLPADDESHQISPLPSPLEFHESSNLLHDLDMLTLHDLPVESASMSIDMNESSYSLNDLNVSVHQDITLTPPTDKEIFEFFYEAQGDS